MGWETNGIHLKIDNVEMPNKHEVSLGSCVFFFFPKMHLSFLKNWLWTLDRVFIVASFYSDAD